MPGVSPDTKAMPLNLRLPILVYLVINAASFVCVPVAQVINLWPHRLETGATE